MRMAISSIDDGLRDIREGRWSSLSMMNRENEGDIMIAAEKVTPEAVVHGTICLRSYLFVSHRETVRELKLPLMVRTIPLIQDGFTVSIEAKQGVTTGISARQGPYYPGCR
jgi:3,4-dihydroxy 2-butanone 4-phosphate synthase/GTP cyclohydrolase II